MSRLVILVIGNLARMYMYVCVYVCMYVWMDVCMYACMYVCMRVCMYIQTLVALPLMYICM